jgi:hypothetical protein
MGTGQDLTCSCQEAFFIPLQFPLSLAEAGGPGRITYPCRKWGVMETFYCGFYSAYVYAVSANGQKMVQKRHGDVYRIETTIKHDINVSITPPFLQG